MIASDIFTDEFFCELSITERLLWIGIIAQCADDQGRLQDKPHLINSRVFPDDGFPISIINKGLNKFYQSGKITRYEIGDKCLIQILKWWVYQTPAWASPSKYPAPDKWIDRIKCHTSGNKILSENWEKIGGYVAGYVPPIHSGIEDGDVNGDGDGDGKADAIPEQDLFTIYQNEIGNLTPFIADGLKDWEREYPKEWFAPAIKDAIEHGARNFKYVDTILRRWKVQGFKSNSKPEKKTELSQFEKNKLVAEEFIQEVQNGEV
jgi:DnaD/phage-associated family protein